MPALLWYKIEYKGRYKSDPYKNHLTRINDGHKRTDRRRRMFLVYRSGI